jgi:catalase
MASRKPSRPAKSKALSGTDRKRASPPSKPKSSVRAPLAPRKRAKDTGSAKPVARSTVSGPAALPQGADLADVAVAKLAGTAALAAAMPYNATKAAEYGDAARAPVAGATVEPAQPFITGSTLTEVNASPKTGSQAPLVGFNPTVGPLSRVRVDSANQALTTNQGVPIADNQNSLKAGLRGPALLEDFILREKITHFDHERIPERIVHARGSAAHGYFECYEPLSQYTRASLFSEAGKRTPVFVRFSTVAGERGSADTVRDVRGFAVKFYTDEGNWDLVGNNIPVFFIQDAMKFPDLVHALKPEPHFAMPQASSAHDTFWDFVSLMPESVHMQMWVMSDRAIPRSYRMMQGFGVHTFRFVNAAGESVFVKFHWSPLAGTHSLDWDEAVKICGADPDFHRRDLWEAIEAGEYPQYELGVQIFTEEQAEKFSFDVLDATKIVPEELVPVRPVGRLVLDRNPDNFFAETEQVAFCTAHIVPGLDFSNDPLLAGRIHSYVDTQLTRLGGPNFHEIPINAPIAQVHNNQRDGFHRQAIHRGRVAYEPNSLAGGCPFQAGMKGFVSFPQPVNDDKVRGKPEKFADHYSQARLFFESQSVVEQQHIVRAFRFELTRVQTPAIRERVVSQLVNVSAELAAAVAAGLGMDVPDAQPMVLERLPRSEVKKSEALSLFARPGDGTIRTRRIAIVIAPGVEHAAISVLQEALSAEGAVPRLVGAKLGPLQTRDGRSLEVDVTLEAAPAVLFDALVLPDVASLEETNAPGHTMEFIKDQYRHCKAILAIGAGSDLLEAAGIPPSLPSGTADPGILLARADAVDAMLPRFIAAVARHRHFERQSDPPRV